MGAISMFIRNFPELRRQAAHLIWPVKIRFWAQSFEFYARLAKEERARKNLPLVGDPNKRLTCCGMRPKTYGRNSTVSGIEDLNGILKSRGAGWQGYIRFYQCAICGQEWIEDWHQERFGGVNEVKKI